MELVEVLWAVTVGPPEARVLDVERGGGFGIEGDLLRGVGGDFDGLLEFDVFDLALEDAFLRGIGDVFYGGLDGYVGGIGFG